MDALAVFCLIRSRSFTRYIALGLFLVTSILATSVSFAILATYGYKSHQYYYFYFYTDALMTIFLFFVLMGLYAHVFAELGVGKYVRAGAMLILAGTALVSIKIVAGSSHGKMLPLFIMELSQNLYFVGLVLTYVLWGAVMKLRETRTRCVCACLLYTSGRRRDNASFRREGFLGHTRWAAPTVPAAGADG